MAEIQPTSFRFSADEIALIDAAAVYYAKGRKVHHTRKMIVRMGLGQLVPPKDALGPEVAEWRRRYSTVFGSPQ